MRFKISIMGPDFAFFAIAQTPMTIGPLLDHFLAVGFFPGRSESLLRASCELAPLGIRPVAVKLLRAGAAMRRAADSSAGREGRLCVCLVPGES
jgi:hypothetical protein